MRSELHDHQAHIVVAGAITRADVPGLCERLGVVIAHQHLDVVICEVGAVHVDLDAVHALASMQLTARRLDARVCLHNATIELQGLLTLCGLGQLLAGR
jgi:ABC-type transporter Mla MlaB component